MFNLVLSHSFTQHYCNTSEKSTPTVYSSPYPLVIGSRNILSVLDTKYSWKHGDLYIGELAPMD